MPRKVLKWGNYVREETICGNTVICNKWCTTFITTLLSVVYHCASWNLFFNFVESIIAYTKVNFDTISSDDNFSIISNFKLCTTILIFSTEIGFEKIDESFRFGCQNDSKNLNQTRFCHNKPLCFSLFEWIYYFRWIICFS